MVLFSAILHIGLLLPMVEQFHRVTLAGVGLNAVALPLMGLLLAVAIPTVLLALIAPSAAGWPLKVLTRVFQLLFGIAEWPRLPAWLSYRVPSPPSWMAVGFAASLVALTLSFRFRRRLALTISAGAFAGFALSLMAAPFAPQVESGVFESTALDCRGGEAVFLTLPDQSTILIGAGGTGRARSQPAPAKKWDPGENIVSPYLRSRRIKALDVVVVTSVAGNLDGFVSILQNFRVGELWFQNSDDLAAIVDEAARRHVALRAISPGERLRVGGAVLEVLAPSPAARVSTGTGALDLRVTSSGATVAVAGSTSFTGQQRLLASNGDARTLILATGRQTLVWAADSNIPDRDPPLSGPDLPEDLRDDDLRIASVAIGSRNRVFRTDRDGAIKVEIRGDRLRIAGFREWMTRSLTSRAGEEDQ